MNTPSVPIAAPSPHADEYGAQLQRLARAMSTGNPAEIVHLLEEASAAERLEWFISGNFDKRADWLRRMLPLVAESLDDFDELAGHYVEARPLAAIGFGVNDADAFLAWLEEMQPLSPAERDYVACQRARHALEDLARERRLDHVRFQEVQSLSGKLAPQLGREAGAALRIQVNPIHVWATLHTSGLLGGQATPPAEVLFFALSEGSSAAVLAPTAQALVRELAEKGPWTLDQWACFTQHSERRELLDLCRRLAPMGAVGFL